MNSVPHWSRVAKRAEFPNLKNPKKSAGIFSFPNFEVANALQVCISMANINFKQIIKNSLRMCYLEQAATKTDRTSELLQNLLPALKSGTLSSASLGSSSL